ncbi:MAG: hypothetical protein JST19_21640 [Bacteroidetes bacterium]|nr:hypothetical protein [Bacteroidota bacterium]
MIPTTIHRYTRLAIINFMVLTIAGLLLRYIHIGDIAGINYQFLLHAHSHFAFSGWMFFSIALLIAGLIDKNVLSAAFKWVLVLALVSAYGMLVSFYLQGYKPVSIAFSTLFVLVTYRFTYLALRKRALKNSVNALSYRLIRAALLFLCLSSIGPFALGPLMAAGLKNTPYYQDAVYIYLHFQMNGFMLLAAWGLFVSALPEAQLMVTNKRWLNLFVSSTVVLYFIFTLWSRPGLLFQVIAALGAVVNLISWIALGVNYRYNLSKCSLLVKAAFIATTLKTLFQVFVCIPPVGEWVFSNRDLIIGYIHLLTLGIVTPLIFDQMLQRGYIKNCRPAIGAYLGAAIVYLILLFTQPLLAHVGLLIPGYQFLLFGISLLFFFIPIAFFKNSH